MATTEVDGYSVPAMNEQEWAAFVLDARTKLGLTQRQLADRLAVQPLQVSRWERGENTPPPARQAHMHERITRLLRARPTA